jgi:hypothetical protein
MDTPVKTDLGEMSAAMHEAVALLSRDSAAK